MRLQQQQQHPAPASLSSSSIYRSTLNVQTSTMRDLQRSPNEHFARSRTASESADLILGSISMVCRGSRAATAPAATGGSSGGFLFKDDELAAVNAAAHTQETLHDDANNEDDDEDISDEFFLDPEEEKRSSVSSATAIKIPGVESLGNKTTLMLPSRPLFECPETIPLPRWPDGMFGIEHSERFIGSYPRENDDSLFATYDTLLGKPATQLVKSMPDKDDPDIVYEASYRHKTGRRGEPTPAEDDTCLAFESRFECGNLQQAVRTGEFEYDLRVRKDINTRGHTQWFFFRVRNTRANTPYTFNIVNLLKPASLYNGGMRPVMYSEKVAQFEGVGWKRAGYGIGYYQSINEEMTSRKYHTLQFTVVFPYDHDTCYLAHFYPYTYTDLQRKIFALKSDPTKKDLLRHKVLCKTNANNHLDIITVTTKSDTPEDLENRECIIVSARVHPGETNSSWMMSGFLDFITSAAPAAQELRDRYIIKILPMLNPDGVIVGNHRCNLKGYDLNRCWDADERAQRAAAPEIAAVSDMIDRLVATRKVSLFIDLHGHNRKFGVFAYGCHNDDTPFLRYKERVFPYLLAKRAPDMFHFRRCQFKMQREKRGTARITMRNKYGILNTLTIEASFCGTDVVFGSESKGGFHFAPSDLERMGHALGEVCHEYLKDSKPSKKTRRNAPGVAVAVSGSGSSNETVHDEASDEDEESTPEHVPAFDVHQMIVDGMRACASGLQAEDSDGESDNTSDDEALRIKKPRAKRLVKRESKISNSAPTARASASRPSSASSTRGGGPGSRSRAGSMSVKNSAFAAVSAKVSTSRTYNESPYSASRIRKTPPSNQQSRAPQSADITSRSVISINDFFDDSKRPSTPKIPRSTRVIRTISASSATQAIARPINIVSMGSGSQLEIGKLSEPELRVFKAEKHSEFRSVVESNRTKRSATRTAGSASTSSFLLAQERARLAAASAASTRSRRNSSHISAASEKSAGTPLAYGVVDLSRGTRIVKRAEASGQNSGRSNSSLDESGSSGSTLSSRRNSARNAGSAGFKGMMAEYQSELSATPFVTTTAVPSLVKRALV